MTLGWPLIFKVKFWKVVTQEWDARLTWNKRDVSRLNVGPMLWLSTLTSPMTLTLDFQCQIWNSCIPWMGGSIDMDWKGYESIGCYTYSVTLSYDRDLGFSRSNFENSISQELEGQLTWNQRDVSRSDGRLTLWLWNLTSPMTLTLIFKVNFGNNYLRNSRIDQHETKVIWVDRMLHLLCDLELWLWPWILKVKF